MTQLNLGQDWEIAVDAPNNRLLVEYTPTATQFELNEDGTLKPLDGGVETDLLNGADLANASAGDSIKSNGDGTFSTSPSQAKTFVQDTEPTSPEDADLWLDTSVNPPSLTVYSVDSASFESVGADVPSTTSEISGQITNTYTVDVPADDFAFLDVFAHPIYINIQNNPESAEIELRDAGGNTLELTTGEDFYNYATAQTFEDIVIDNQGGSAFTFEIDVQEYLAPRHSHNI